MLMLVHSCSLGVVLISLPCGIIFGVGCLNELLAILWRQRYWRGSIYSLVCAVVPRSGPGAVAGYSMLLLLYYSLVTYCYFYHFHIHSVSTV